MKPQQKVRKNLNNSSDLVSLNIDNFKLPHDHVIVTPVGLESELVKPEQYDDKPEFGRIVKVGKKVNDTEDKSEFNIEEGDVVLFGQWSTILVRIHKVDYYIMRSEDVIAIVQKKNP